MKRTSLMMIMGVMLFMLAAAAFVTVQADAAPALQETVVPSPTSTALSPPVDLTTTKTPLPFVDTSPIVLWDAICVKKVPYTILSIPADASFELVAADGSIIPSLETATPVPGENSCRSVMTIGDRLVLLCTGQQGMGYTIRVTNGSEVLDFEVPMKSCPIKPDQGPTDTPTPGVMPTLPPDMAPTPDNVPFTSAP